MSITLTAAAIAAAQFLGIDDSGEGLSTQQLADALAAANNLLANWANEQTLSMQILISQQTRAGAKLLAQQLGAGNVFVQDQYEIGAPQALAYTLSGGAYTPPQYSTPNYIPPSFAPGAVPQFADATTPITLPAGYDRAFKLSLAIELASQYSMPASESLIRQATEARAAASPIPGKLPIPGMSAASEAPQGG